jgi:hypothetical protein
LSATSPEVLSLVWHRTKEAVAKNLGAVVALVGVLAVGSVLDLYVVPLHRAASVIAALAKALGVAAVSLALARPVLSAYVEAEAVESAQLERLNKRSAMVVPAVLFAILFVSFEAGAWGFLVMLFCALVPLLEAYFFNPKHPEDAPLSTFSFLRRQGKLFCGVQLASAVAFFVAFILLSFGLGALVSDTVGGPLTLALLAPAISIWLVFRLELFLELHFQEESVDLFPPPPFEPEPVEEPFESEAWQDQDGDEAQASSENAQYSDEPEEDDSRS